MRYDVSLFQFIFNLMEILCLVQESMKCPVGWLKLTTRNSNRSEIYWNRHKNVGKAFMSRAIIRHWYPIVSIDFHDHAMVVMMVLRQGYALVFVSSDARKHFQGMDFPMGVPTELGRCVDAHKGVTRVLCTCCICTTMYIWCCVHVVHVVLCTYGVVCMILQVLL